MSYSEDETRKKVKELFEAGEENAAYDFYVNSEHATKPVMTFHEFSSRMREPVSQESRIGIYFGIMIGLCVWAMFQLDYIKFFE
jgi:hypothetical protein